MKLSKVAELKGHAGPLYKVQTGRNEDHVFTAGSDRILAEWNLKSVEAASFSIQTDNPIYDFLHLKDQNLLIIGQSTGSFHVIDVKHKKEIRHLAYHKSGVFALHAQDGWLFSGDEHGTVAVWSIPDFGLQRVLELPEGKIRAFQMLDKTLYIGHQSGYLFKIDLGSGQTIGSFPAHDKSVYSLAFHPTKPVLLSGGNDGFIRCWKTTTGEKLLEFPAHNSSVYDMQFSPNGQWLATASRDKTIKLWNAGSMDFVQKLQRLGDMGHRNSVNSVVWLNDQQLVSCSDDGVAIQWQAL